MSDAPSSALMDKPKSKAKKKAADDSNVFVSTATAIEKLEKEEAFSRVPELLDSVDFNYFQLGGVLAVIQSNDWAKEEGFDSFRDLVEHKFGLHYRKAMYLVGIYTSLIEAEVPFDKVAGIGWSKLKEIASVVTPDNVEEWVAKAQDNTVLQLIELVKKAKEGTLQKSDETPDEGPKNVTTFSVKVHADQKTTIANAIDKAKKEADTEFPGVALEAICMGYLAGASGGTKAAKPKSLKAVMEGYSYEEVLEAFEVIWPDIDITATVKG